MSVRIQFEKMVWEIPSMLDHSALASIVSPYPIGYRQMCRFFSISIWEFAFLYSSISSLLFLRTSHFICSFSISLYPFLYVLNHFLTFSLVTYFCEISSFLRSHPLVVKYDYIWRLDSDSYFYSHVPYDVIAEMDRNGKVLRSPFLRILLLILVCSGLRVYWIIS